MPSQGFKRVGNFEINLDRELGGGGFGKVYRATDLSQTPPEECAAKHVVFHAGCPQAQVEREVALTRAAGPHSSIIGIFGYEGGDDSAWIFMEVASGGELFDRLIDSGSLSERAARPYASALIAALHHCHSRGIIHRDVKLENVMLCAEDPHAVKLIDFGLAVQVRVGADGTQEALKFYDGVGSKSYKAPELFYPAVGYLAPPVDVWALGITLFSLLGGFFPFDMAKARDWRFARFAEDVGRGMNACDALFGQYNRTCRFSAEAKQMLDGMLQIDPAARLTLPALMRHAWLSCADDEDASAVSGECVYRGLGGGDSEPADISLPENCMRITRQPAAVGDDVD